jgi:hypothetical protein
VDCYDIYDGSGRVQAQAYSWNRALDTARNLATGEHDGRPREGVYIQDGDGQAWETSGEPVYD